MDGRGRELRENWRNAPTHQNTLFMDREGGGKRRSTAYSQTLQMWGKSTGKSSLPTYITRSRNKPVDLRENSGASCACLCLATKRKQEREGSLRTICKNCFSEPTTHGSTYTHLHLRVRWHTVFGSVTSEERELVFRSVFTLGRFPSKAAENRPHSTAGSAHVVAILKGPNRALFLKQCSILAPEPSKVSFKSSKSEPELDIHLVDFYLVL